MFIHTTSLGSGMQVHHTDFCDMLQQLYKRMSEGTKFTMPYICLMAFKPGTKVFVWDQITGDCTELDIPVGSAFIAAGDVIHAGMPQAKKLNTNTEVKFHFRGHMLGTTTHFKRGGNRKKCNFFLRKELVDGQLLWFTI